MKDNISLFEDKNQEEEKIDVINVNKDYKNVYLFKRNSKREIVPCADKEKNRLAKKRLEEIFKECDNIPERFIKNKDRVKLYDAKGRVEKAKGLILKPKKGAYDLRNKLNDLTGKEWTKFTCSWFIFNALQSDLKQEKEVTEETESHPATFSPTMISKFIKFFTKKGQNVLDPFAGIGSTLEGCKRTGRTGFGIELIPKYYDIILKRTPKFEKNIFNIDARNIDELDLPKIHYSISSPPYWNMLKRSTGNFKKRRTEKGLDVNYSDSKIDLGNIEDYDTFIKELASIYFKIYDLLEEGSYITIIIKNVKKEGKLYPLAWDLAKKLSSKYVLKDEKIWIQDKIGLAPYGYPYAWVSNILHHYCLNLRKEG